MNGRGRLALNLAPSVKLHPVTRHRWLYITPIVREKPTLNELCIRGEPISPQLPHSRQRQKEFGLAKQSCLMRQQQLMQIIIRKT